MSTDALAGPIVGRDAELAELDAMVGALKGGRSACVAVEGEPGIGKTSLLAELRRRAEERGCLVLDGVAAEFERDLPFSVWTDALDAHVASLALDPEALGPLDVVLELGEVLPSLRPRAPGAGSRWRRSATAAIGRSARCSRCWPPSARSCSCSTTCTGATPPRSS